MSHRQKGDRFTRSFEKFKGLTVKLQYVTIVSLKHLLHTSVVDKKLFVDDKWRDVLADQLVGV
jgi:hypothetical protein